MRVQGSTEGGRTVTTVMTRKTFPPGQLVETLGPKSQESRVVPVRGSRPRQWPCKTNRWRSRCKLRRQQLQLPRVATLQQPVTDRACSFHSKWVTCRNYGTTPSRDSLKTVPLVCSVNKNHDLSNTGARGQGSLDLDKSIVFFEQTHNQGLRQLSLDIFAWCDTLALIVSVFLFNSGSNPQRPG